MLGSATRAGCGEACLFFMSEVATKSPGSDKGVADSAKCADGSTAGRCPGHPWNLAPG